MICFSTNGEKECTDVICHVDFGTTKPSDNCSFSFKCHTGDAHFAYLLASHFQERLRSEIKKAHQRAYEIGYKDGKGKQKKKCNFDGHLGDSNPAW